jgi:hypothetical protein
LAAVGALAVAACGGSAHTRVGGSGQKPIGGSAQKPVDWSNPNAHEVFEHQFAGVVAGKGVPEAAAYAGYRHPMVFIGLSWESSINQEVNFHPAVSPPINGALLPKFVSEVQLVGYVTDRALPAGSCGEYTRRSDGMKGEVLHTTAVTTVRVIVARTGQTIATRTFIGKEAECPESTSEPTGNPPWTFDGIPPAYRESDAVTHWVDSLLTGPVRTAEPKKAAVQAGVWQAEGMTITIRIVGGKPTVISAKYEQETVKVRRSNWDGSTLAWSYRAPSTGFLITSSCPAFTATSMICSWANGHGGSGSDTFKRVGQ